MRLKRKGRSGMSIYFYCETVYLGDWPLHRKLFKDFKSLCKQTSEIRQLRFMKFIWSEPRVKN